MPVTSTPADRLERLRAELRRIREVLAGQPSVRQLVVFGSMAAGRVHEASDLDLMVVQETDQPFVERAVRLARLVGPRVGVQFLVYTPAEIRAMRARPFVDTEILRKGRVVPLRPSDEARKWFAFAEEDLRTAELALGAGIFNQACFHAQQVAEKCLKGCLVAMGEPLLRTHMIVDLLGELPAPVRAVFAEFEAGLTALDQFYVATRYPDALPGTLPEGLPERSHAEAALVSARRCYDNARRWLDAQPDEA